MFNIDQVKSIVNDFQEPTLTIYLNVSAGVQENQAQHPAWNIWLKNALGDLEKGLQDETKSAWKVLHENVNTFFDTYQPTSRGLVVFADANGLRDYPVPFHLDNQAHYGKPVVAPLLWAIDEYEPYVIALVDQEKAHFFVASMGSTDGQGHLQTDIQEYDFGEKTHFTAGGSGVTAGNDRDDFEDTLQEHRNRFYRDVIVRIDSLSREHGAERVILGGAEAAANDVKNMFEGKMKDALIDVLPIPLRSTMAAIMERVQPAAEAFERQGEMTLVQQVIDFAKSGGRGALGKKDVMDALTQGRVELLVIPYPMEDEALITRLTLEALQMNSQIEMVRGEAADRLHQEGGLGARLYYALPQVTVNS